MYNPFAHYPPDQIEVRVTYEDIVDGERGSSTHCPIARAIRRQVDEWYIAVFKASDIVIVGRKYAAPEWVNDFIHAFDSGYVVRPISFYVTAVDG